MKTVTDLFCGAGGTMTGAKQAGAQGVIAANHSPKAIASHSANHPDVEHDIADISQVDPRRYPATDVLLASPECTNWSVAKGMRRPTAQPALFGDQTPDPIAERSRATMWDVPRFAEAMVLRGTPYETIIVENVVDIRAGILWRAWTVAMEDLGYDRYEVYLNSAFAHGKDYVGAPQWRDRIYIVFRRRGMPKVDLDITPPAWCSRCERRVNAVQAWKRADARWGKYRSQYLYLCPDAHCRTVVEPLALPAAAIIDWSSLGPRIGDRRQPLKPKTRARIATGLARYTDPLLVPAGGTRNETATSTSRPARTRTTRETEALVCPPLLIPVEGRAEASRVTQVGQPARTQSTRHETALAVPGSFLAVLRNNCDAVGLDTPAMTVAAAGEHQALVTPPLSLLAAYYGKGTCSPTSRPAPTHPTHDRFGLIGAHAERPEVDDCTFRMLDVPEIQQVMGFPVDYQVLGNRRDRVLQLGNAVTPPAARLLMERVLAADGAAA